MKAKTGLMIWGVGAALVVASTSCSDRPNAKSLPTTPAASATAAPRVGRIAPSRKARTLQELRDRSPVRWGGDSVQSVIRAYRADYVARRKAKLPLKGVCEGLSEYFTTRNSWGRSLATGGAADLLAPKCGASTKKIRFFSTNHRRRAPEGEAYVTSRSMALLDSLQQITARVDAANRSAGEAVSMLTAGIDRVETLASNSSLTDQEYELVMTVSSGLAGAVSEAQAMVPAVMEDISSSVDECVQRLGYVPSDPSACDQEIYQTFGPMSHQLPQQVLMCTIALKASPIAAPRPPCDGHEIIEGIAYGFIGGAVGGAWAGLIGTGGLGVPLTALLGGIGGAASGLAVGLAKTIWCEMQT